MISKLIQFVYFKKNYFLKNFHQKTTIKNLKTLLKYILLQKVFYKNVKWPDNQTSTLRNQNKIIRGSIYSQFYLITFY